MPKTGVLATEVVEFRESGLDKLNKAIDGAQKMLESFEKAFGKVQAKLDSLKVSLDSGTYAKFSNQLAAASREMEVLSSRRQDRSEEQVWQHRWTRPRRRGPQYYRFGTDQNGRGRRHRRGEGGCPESHHQLRRLRRHRQENRGSDPRDGRPSASSPTGSTSKRSSAPLKASTRPAST